MFKVIEVQNRKDLHKFIKFPDELYKDCPQYVPALHFDQIKSLTKVSTLSYCQRRMWMVVDSDKVVGRICGMINPHYNERYGTHRARFGWFDCIDDLEVARLLISTAESWAKSQEMNEIHGPLYYNTLGKQGMLVEGFENIPPFNCIYNYPYYNDLVTELGFKKECDWIQYRMDASQGVPAKAIRVGEFLKERYNLHVGDINRMKKDPEKVREFFKVYNDAFAKNVYNFIPFTEEEMKEEAASSIPFISDKSSCIIVDENENLVAFGISFPSISKALQKAKGHLFPFGWFHILRAMHNYEITDLMLNGSSPEWQNRGASALYYTEILGRAQSIGMKWAVSNPQIETNAAVKLWNSYDHELYMRRRCYLKKID